MRPDYHISSGKPETTSTELAYFLRIQRLLLRYDQRAAYRPSTDRNLFTRTIDTLIEWVRKYAPPVHWLGAALLAVVLFVYVRLVILTSQLLPVGERIWPDVPPPCVIALWHKDAPSLLVAFAMKRPRARSYIMISADPRGDFLALLCRMLGFRIVRGGAHEGGWEALVELSQSLKQGALVFITADGGGPAQVAKVGALALASAASVPVLPLAADSYPAIEESHKWDAARNPLPLSTVFVGFGGGRVFEPFANFSSVESAMEWLKRELDQVGLAVAQSRSAVGSGLTFRK